MVEFFALLPPDLLQQPWVIPVIGVAAAGLAFAVGRRLFVARQAPAISAPESPVGSAEPEGEPADVFLHGSANDRRSSPRRRGNSVAVAIRNGSDHSTHGYVLDRSLGGLCLLVENEMTEGATLDVRPEHAPETTPWVTIQVRSCRRRRSEWELGCQFMKTPNWNVLLLFG